MVRLKDRDDLNDVRGTLGAGFRLAARTTLHADFLAPVHAQNKIDATRALDTLYAAADSLRDHERAFNARARSNTPSLMRNLRDAKHFAALREFNAAKEGLLDINPPAAERIIKMVEKKIHPPAPRI